METRDVDHNFVGYDDLSVEFDRVFGKWSVSRRTASQGSRRLES